MTLIVYLNCFNNDTLNESPKTTKQAKVCEPLLGL